jgi:hypothetical protein
VVLQPHYRRDDFCKEFIMTNIAALFSGAEFNDPFSIDWREHPQANNLPAPTAITLALQDYSYEPCNIRVDVSGPLVTLDRCGPQRFNYNFLTGDGVLLGDVVPGARPIHLTFTPGIRAVGAQISADGPVGTNYAGHLAVRMSDGTWELPVSNNGVLSRTRGSAPFVGAMALNGLSIVEAAFYAVNLSTAQQFKQVAINDLYFDTV